MAIIKKRLDIAISEIYPEYTRNQIQSFIMQGFAFVDDQKEVKPGTQVKESQKIELKVVNLKYVCRAGFKLEGALDSFEIDVQNLVILDSGLSTGGFTDCMLQRGAKRIYGVDVGHGQVHEKIRQNDKVIVMEKTNLRYLKSLPEQVDLVTLDLSFISVLKVIESINLFLKENGSLIVLIKPQFEAKKEQVGKGGIVRDSKVHDEVINNIKDNIVNFGFKFIDIIESPIYGAEGNKEFLAYFKRVKL